MTRLQAALQPAQPPGEAAPADVCAGPGPDYNTENACFDVAPRAQAAPIVPLTEQVQGTPTRAFLWVLVSPEGRPQRIQVQRASNDAQFTRLAQGFAFTLLFNPAQKAGQHVEGWVLMQFVPAPR
jgi:protein TonB